MFTGLIEEVGKVSALENARGSGRVTIAAPRITRELRQGDSVAASGVCLTAVNIDVGKSFSADLAVETLARTSFSKIQKGATVNLELPVKAGARLGGHVVQGHVDGTGKLLSLTPVKNGGDYWLRIQIPRSLIKYAVEKGSITIEGISLTIAKLVQDEITIAIIPHTYQSTNLKFLKKDDALNLEVDVLAKYAEKMSRPAAAQSSITLQRLLEEGF